MFKRNKNKKTPPPPTGRDGREEVSLLPPATATAKPPPRYEDTSRDPGPDPHTELLERVLELIATPPDDCTIKWKKTDGEYLLATVNQKTSTSGTRQRLVFKVYYNSPGLRWLVTTGSGEPGEWVTGKFKNDTFLTIFENLYNRHEEKTQQSAAQRVFDVLDELDG